MIRFSYLSINKAQEHQQNVQQYQKDSSILQKTMIFPSDSEDKQYCELDSQKQQRECHHCKELIDGSQFQDHQGKCKESCVKSVQNYVTLTESRITCAICEKYIARSAAKDHESQCTIQPYDHLFRSQIAVNYADKDYRKKQFIFHLCIWCHVKIPQEQQQLHVTTCQTKRNIFLNLVSFNLTSPQLRTMWKIYEKSGYDDLLYRRQTYLIMQKYGYNETDLALMSDYIQNRAPICIHFNLSNCIPYFVIDFEFRNAFETWKGQNQSYVKSRMVWENYLFGDEYDHCFPNQRVKYGVLNYANDKYGSRKCNKYGDSIIILNQEIRKRCTISDNRKYAPNETVATLKYNSSVLWKFSPDELHALYLASRGFQIDSSNLKHFKEVHIHGPILFERDIKCIYTSQLERDRNIANVEIFQRRFGVKILTFQDIEAGKVK